VSFYNRPVRRDSTRTRYRSAGIPCKLAESVPMGIPKRLGRPVVSPGRSTRSVRIGVGVGEHGHLGRTSTARRLRRRAHAGDWTSLRRPPGVRSPPAQTVRRWPRDRRSSSMCHATPARRDGSSTSVSPLTAMFSESTTRALVAGHVGRTLALAASAASWGSRHAIGAVNAVSGTLELTTSSPCRRRHSPRAHTGVLERRCATPLGH